MGEPLLAIRGVDSLKHELDRAREDLRNTDASIERLVGRAAQFGNRPFPPRRQSAPARPGLDDVRGGFGRGAGAAGPLFMLAGYDNAGPPSAKRQAGAFSRLGLPLARAPRPLLPQRNENDDDDELPHKLVSSSVVATPKDTKSREEAIAAQKSVVGGQQGQARDRRMFGLLLGTLARFKDDERTKAQQAEKRKAVEKRLEVKEKEEETRMQRERQQLFEDRKKAQRKLRLLEQKMELVEIHEAWEQETTNLENFVRTNSKPHVYFLPKTHNAASSTKLEDSKRVLRNLVAERRKQLEEEIEELMKRESKADQSLEHDEEMPSDIGEELEEGEVTAQHVTKKVTKKHRDIGDKGEASDLEEDHGIGVDYEMTGDVAVSHDTRTVVAMEVSEVREERKSDLPDEASKRERAVSEHETVEHTAEEVKAKSSNATDDNRPIDKTAEMADKSETKDKSPKNHRDEDRSPRRRRHSEARQHGSKHDHHKSSHRHRDSDVENDHEPDHKKKHVKSRRHRDLEPESSKERKHRADAEPERHKDNEGVTGSKAEKAQPASVERRKSSDGENRAKNE